MATGCVILDETTQLFAACHNSVEVPPFGGIDVACVLLGISFFSGLIHYKKTRVNSVSPVKN